MIDEDPYKFHTDDNASSIGEEVDDGMVNIKFKLGDVVAAKLGRWPYWPAMVDIDPDTNEFYWVEGANKTDATHYNVVFFDADGKVSRSWVPSQKITYYSSHFPKKSTEEESGTASKPKSVQLKNLFNSRRLAEDALEMDVEERIQKYSFIHTYEGKIKLFDDAEGTCQIIDNKETSKKYAKKAPSKSAAKTGTKKKRGRKSKEELARIALAAGDSPPKLSTSQPTRRSEPLENTTDAVLVPSRKSDPPSLEPSSLKLRITKDKSNGKHYSTKIPVTRDASNELSEQLSEFAKSFPPSPESGATEMPKKRGRKRKQSGPKAVPKSKKAKPGVPPSDSTAFEILDDVVNKSSSSQAESTLASPCSAPIPPISVAETGSSRKEPTQQDQRQVGVALSIQVVPPEETMANKITDVIHRMQNLQELPARLQTKKSLSNVGLVVEHDPFVDLTLDEESEAKTWEKGEVVFANLRNVQPWPAVVVGDPSYGNRHMSPSGGAPAELVHVNFLEMNYHAWVPVGNVHKFSMRDAEHMTTSSHKFIAALETANRAITMTPSDRIATYCPSSQPQKVGRMFREDTRTKTWEKGEVVFANLRNVQPWPAVVVGDPSNGNRHISLFGGAPPIVHVRFLEMDHRVWVPVGNVRKFLMKDAEVLAKLRHKFITALETATAAISMSASIRIATYSRSSQPQKVCGMFQSGEIIVLD